MKKKALIIDDNEKNLLLAKDLLEVADFEVFEAAEIASVMSARRLLSPSMRAI
jgi:hypothetical protein